MRKNKMIELTTRKGYTVLVEEVYNRTSLSVALQYKLPINLHSKFDGVPHMVEHLIFNDIIDYTTSSELFALADTAGCSINASTGNQNITFKVSLDTFDLPRTLTRTNAYSRFNIVDEGLEFIRKYISGIVKRHVFGYDELQKEKGIVLAEQGQKINDKSTKVHHALSKMFHNRSVIGLTPEAIKNMNTGLINDFLECLPEPVLAVSYNPEIDSLDGVIDLLSDALNCIEGPKRPLEKQTHTSPRKIDYVDTVTTFLEHPSQGCKTTNLNTICVLHPKTIKHDISSMESNLLQSLSMSMILDVLTKGSLGEFLREEKNLIYSFSRHGIVNKIGNNELVALCAILNDEGPNLSFKNQRVDFIKMIDNFIIQMETPSVEKYLSVLRDYASTYKHNLIHGCGARYLLSINQDGGSMDYIEKKLAFESDFSYRNFKVIFEQTLVDMNILLL